jgi:hypothetical protein
VQHQPAGGARRGDILSRRQTEQALRILSSHGRLAAQLVQHGAGLPQFVEREFREFLTCGVFEHGNRAIPVRGLRARAPGAVFV